MTSAPGDEVYEWGRLARTTYQLIASDGADQDGHSYENRRRDISLPSCSLRRTRMIIRASFVGVKECSRVHSGRIGSSTA